MISLFSCIDHLLRVYTRGINNMPTGSIPVANFKESLFVVIPVEQNSNPNNDNVHYLDPADAWTRQST
jgi:hypothetical protein